MERDEFIKKISVYTELYVGIVIGIPLLIVSLSLSIPVIRPIASFTTLNLVKVGLYGLSFTILSKQTDRKS
jgi:hypothetical protein